MGPFAQTTSPQVNLGSSAGGAGTLTVSGTGSQWTGTTTTFNVGNGTGSTGAATVSAGGLISSRGLTIGGGRDATGSVTVTGAGSRWDLNQDAVVGGAGTGTLTVSAGAVVQDRSAFIGIPPEVLGQPSAAGSVGSVTVTGAGSQWNHAQVLTVGGNSNNTIGSPGGSGTLTVSSGGQVSSQSLNLAAASATNGTVTVGGTNSRLDVDDGWTIGRSLAGGAAGENAGTLTINTGATVTVGLKPIAFNQAPPNPINATGTLNLNGGTLVASNLTFAGGVFNWAANGPPLVVRDNFTAGAGTTGTGLALTAGKVLQAGNVTVANGAQMSLDGGTLTAGTLNVNGTFRLGPGTPALAVAGATVGVTDSAGAGLLIVTDSALSAVGFNAAFTNAGEIQLAGTGAQLGGDAPLENRGLLAGSGRVNATLTNQATGEVRAAAGQRLVFTSGAPSDAQLTGANVNAGNVNAEGGSVEFTRALRNTGRVNVTGGSIRVTGAAVNAAGALIGGRDGTYHFDGGLANTGQIALSFGNSDLYGPITNNAGGGSIVISAGGTATFFGDLANNGTVRTSAGSTAVFFGRVSGTGSFTGIGTNFFEGTLSPGPALVASTASFEGDVSLGDAAVTRLELAAGGAHDELDVAGALELAGTLDVVLLDGFVPAPGDRFDLLDFDTLAGRFDRLALPDLGPGLAWDTSALYANGTLGVVEATPEPSAFVLLAAGAFAVTAARRRRGSGRKEPCP